MLSSIPGQLDVETLLSSNTSMRTGSFDSAAKFSRLPLKLQCLCTQIEARVTETEDETYMIVDA